MSRYTKLPKKQRNKQKLINQDDMAQAGWGWTCSFALLCFALPLVVKLKKGKKKKNKRKKKKRKKEKQNIFTEALGLAKFKLKA